MCCFETTLAYIKIKEIKRTYGNTSRDVTSTNRWNVIIEDNKRT